MSKTNCNTAGLSIDTESISEIESLELTSFIQSFLQNLPEDLSSSAPSPKALDLSLSPIAFSALQTEAHEPHKRPLKPSSSLNPWRISEVLTSAKDSFVEIEKPNLHQTSFAVPNKMFCPACLKEVYTLVSFQSAFPSFWENLIKRFKCCNSPNAARQFLVHLCSKCQKVLVRISSE